MSDPITRLNAALEGRYRIERQLGEGGMATVYLADDLKHERKVALKVLKPELAAVVGAERFLAEIKTTANLQHPHILPLFDSGEADTFLFYVMPYVEGESLRERLDREHQLPVDEAVQIAKNVAEALDYAHRQGVIHRDIKPANILLQDGKPVVSDFGIALAVSAAGGGRLTETGLSMGTPYYMSPEQASADQKATGASDLYSLGCVLYEMLVGEPPYSGGSAQAVLAKILMQDAPEPRTARASIPAHVDAAIRKSLEKLPADRFASVQDFARALSEPGFRHGEVAVVGASSGRGLWNPLSLGLAVLAVILGAGLAWSASRSAAPAPVPLPVAHTVVSAPPAAPPVPGQVAFDVAITPDGSRIVYQSGALPAQLSVRALGELGSAPLRGPAAAEWPFVSPDGEWVAYQAGVGGPLQRVSTSGGPPLTIAELELDLWGASWAPDGTIYFGSQGPAGLSQVSSSGGEPALVTDSENRMSHGLPHALPNGAGVLFTISTTPGVLTDNQIAVLDLRTGEQRILFSGSSPRYAASGHLVYVVDGTLMAASFDPERLEATSDPVPMLEGVGQKASGAASFAFSESGSLVYVTGDAASTALRDVVWVDREGTEEPLPLPQRPYSQPRVSPDGSRLAIGVVDEQGRALWVYDVGSAAGQRLTQEGTMQTPVWTSDGRIFFSQVTPDIGTPQIFSVPADGSADPQHVLLTEDGVLGDFPTAVSPDGRSLIFSRIFTLPHREIYQMSLGGEPVATSVLEGEFNRGNAEVSPDGRWLVYRSDQSGSMEVYVQPFPGPGPIIPVSIGGGTSVTWSPDGTELIYRLDDRMMAVPFSAEGDTPTIGRPVELFRGPYVAANLGGAREYHVAPDGRFLMLKNAGVGDQDEVLPPQVVLVLNFFEELRARLPVD
jgi:serine/threonine-protein kinase